MNQGLSPASPRRTLRRRVIGTMVAGLVLPLVAVVTAAPASADTSQFRGMNWARVGDNYSSDVLYIDGLSSSDSYDTVEAKANAVFDDMESTLRINTVRLPINTHTVSSSWWGKYRGVIDAATDRGWKVILAYWEDGAADDGRITDMSAFNSMWSTVTSQYGSNSKVYFEPMNEPHGYSSSEWRDFAADWLDYHYSAPPGRVLVGGTGYSQDLRDLCSDSRFDDTLLSFHYYAFFYGEKTYDGWVTDVKKFLGNCASRAVVTEFGAPMSDGRNYGDANSTDNFVRYIRAITQVMRDNDMGGTYWPGLGGKQTQNLGYDWYSMYAKTGTGTNLDLTIRNQSGAARLRYGFGDDVGTIVNQASGKCVDVVSSSTANAAEVIQYTCGYGANQQWALTPRGNGYYDVIASHSGKCLEVSNASQSDGTKVVQNACNGGTHQQWELRTAGSYVELVARHSGKCLDVPASSTANGTRLKQYTCNSGANQRWTV